MDNAVHPNRPVRRRPGRPRGQDSAVVREAALQAAVDLIAQQGFAATTMAQVAEAAGISPSGLAHHFRSKKDLLAAVLEHRDAMDRLPLPAEMEQQPWAQIDHMVRIAEINSERRPLVLLYTTMIGEAVSPDHPAHEWMLRHYSLVMELLIGGLRADQRAGHVRADAPCENIARALVALMDGLQVQWLLDPSLDMAAVVRERAAEVKLRWGTEQEAP